MKTLKVKPENLEVGKRYFFESIGKMFFGCGTIDSIEYRGSDDEIIWFKNGTDSGFLHSLEVTQCYTFYSVPEDFEFKWNQKCISRLGIYAVMHMKKMYSAFLDLRDGYAMPYAPYESFSDIPDEPDTITISGKTYNLDEVTKRIKELKPMENKQ